MWGNGTDMDGAPAMARSHRTAIELLLDRHGTTYAEQAGIRLDDKPSPLYRLLREFPGIGPTGAAIFAREAQGVWPAFAPFFDRKSLDGARSVGLPPDPKRLDGLVRADERPRLAAALVRAALDDSDDPLAAGQ